MAKHLVQLVIAGVQVVGRAFAKALRQEIAASQAAAQRAGGGAAGVKHSATNQKLGISLEEAKQILNVEELEEERIRKNYDYLFKINDKSQGGSFYIQSKMHMEGVRRRGSGLDSLPAGYTGLWARASPLSPVTLCPARHMATVAMSWEDVLSEHNRRRCVDNLEKMGAVRKFAHDPHRYGAVLIPMCHVDGELSVLFTLRTRMMSSHRGEVSFPGGMSDPSDRDLIDTALREAEEEIGLDRSKVDVWGMTCLMPSRLGDTSVRGVLAYVGHIDPTTLKVQETEVESVLVVSLKNLCNPLNTKKTQYRSTAIPKGFTMPVFTGSDPRIWGLTATILHMTLVSLLPGLYRHKLKHLPPLKV